MSSLILYLSLFITYVNGTDFIQRPWYYIMHPYVAAVGGIEIFLGIVFGVIGIAIYEGTNRNKYAVFIFFSSCTFFFGALMMVTPAGFGFVAIFFMVALFIWAGIMRSRLVENRG